MKTVLTLLDKFFALLVLFFCITVTSTVIYWLYIQPTDILSNLGQNPIVNNGVSNEVRAGGSMNVTRSFCVNITNIVGTVTRSFNNHMVYQLPSTTTLSIPTQKGCMEKTYVVDIPASLPTGDYTYLAHIKYKVNPLKTITYNLAPVPVHVVNPVWDAAKRLSKEK